MTRWWQEDNGRMVSWADLVCSQREAEWIIRIDDEMNMIALYRLIKLSPPSNYSFSL